MDAKDARIQAYLQTYLHTESPMLHPTINLLYDLSCIVWLYPHFSHPILTIFTFCMHAAQMQAKELHQSCHSLANASLHVRPYLPNFVITCSNGVWKVQFCRFSHSMHPSQASIIDSYKSTYASLFMHIYCKCEHKK